ncbi:MAG: methionyl-tRNA formyltransferase, partial [bacterium]
MMRLVFMGTPEFAVESLQALDNCPHEIVGVVTAPDKPVGRGLRVKPSPIKVKAMELNLPILQPADLSAPEFVEEINNLSADIFVVVAFRILPSIIFELPPFGTINLHASLLPRYRGAAPINRAIINGETETGVTIIFIRRDVDAGDIILQEKVSIGEDETAGALHDKLA